MPTLTKVLDQLWMFALSLPSTREEHPWGETAIKVHGRTFVFMRHEKREPGLSLKLSERRQFALHYSFAAPTRYGLSQSGWIAATFSGRQSPPIDVLSAWIEESYRAIAPRKVVAQLAKTPERLTGQQRKPARRR